MTATMAQTDEQLKAWTLAVLADATITFDAPAESHPGAASLVSLYLMELAPLPSTHGKPLSPYQLNLHYLVTVSDADPLKSHRMLAQLVFAAMENGDFELDLAALPAPTWTAFGVAPRPSFVIRIPLRQARPALATRLVEHLPIIRSTTIARPPAA